MTNPDETAAEATNGGSSGQSNGRSIGLALGGGGARGLAHITVLEALDELGLRPAAIAGTSMGAILGAAYAAGMTGAEIRTYILSQLRNRRTATAKVMGARVGSIGAMLRSGFANPLLLDAEIFLRQFWPPAMPPDFAGLQCPLTVIATDFAARSEVLFRTGALASAIAASMAIPGIFQPVLYEGRVLIDGGSVNPLPHDVLQGSGAIIIASDVQGGLPDAPATRNPRPFAAMMRATQIMQLAITREKLKWLVPDVLVQPSVGRFAALDFFAAAQILRAADEKKDDIKRDVERALRHPSVR